MRCLLTALLFSAAFLPAQPVKKSFLEKKTLESYARHLFVWPKEISVAISDPVASGVEGLLRVTVTGSMNGASQNAEFFISKNGEKVMQGVVFDVNTNPFKSNLDKLKTDHQPSYGTSGAPVVVVIFSDFECPYCREEANMIRANLVSTFSKEVRVYFKDFPLEQIHPWAKAAAIAGRCVFAQDPPKFWDYHDWIFQNQEKMTPETLRPKLEEFAAAKKLDKEPLLKCFDTKATEAEVNRNFAEGRLLDVNSTPTLFVNGRKLAGNVSWPQLKQIIEFEVEYQKTAKNAGEDCGCELKLPSPLNGK